LLNSLGRAAEFGTKVKAEGGREGDEERYEYSEMRAT